MEEKTKQAIKDIVADYIKLFPDEYNAFVIQNKYERENQKNALASVIGDSAVQQHVYNMPETLFSMVKMRLTTEQHSDFYSPKEKDKAIQNTFWFAKTFPAFAIATKL